MFFTHIAGHYLRVFRVAADLNSDICFALVAEQRMKKVPIHPPKIDYLKRQEITTVTGT
jgi:hypothetical protein